MCKRKAQSYTHKPYNCTLHLLSHTDLCTTLNTHPTLGLSTPMTQALLTSHGPNTLSTPPQPPPFLLWAKELLDPFLLLLLLASCLAFLAWALDGNYKEVVLAGSLLVIVLLGATISFFTKRAAAKIIDSIKNLLPPHCRVIRDGISTNIPTSSLVLGDVVPIELGNRVPADLCLLSCNTLSVDNSSITGESEPVECVAERASDLPMEARNILFCSSIITSGEGLGVVCATGDDTLVGTIAGAAGNAPGGGGRDTVHAKEFRRLLIFVSSISIITACIFLAIGLGRGLGVVFSITQAFILTLVANVPEGLPATVLIQLTLGAKKLAKKRILVKDCAELPTMGAITVLCTDKTGTLTQGKMSVSTLWDCSSFVRAAGVHLSGTAGGNGTGGGGRGGEGGASLNRQHQQHHEAAARLSSTMAIGRQLSIVWPHDMEGGIAVVHPSSFSMPPSLPPPSSASGVDDTLANPSAPSTFLLLPPSTTTAHTGALIPPGESLNLIHRALSNPALIDAPPSHRLLIARSRSISSRRQMRHASIAIRGGGGGGGSGGSYVPPSGSGAGNGVTLRSQVSHIAIDLPTITEQQQQQQQAGFQPPEGKEGVQAGAVEYSPPSWVPWSSSTAFTRLITIAAVCNKAQIILEATPATAPSFASEEERNRRALPSLSSAATASPSSPPKVLGNASDVALLLFANSLLPINHWSAAYPLQNSTVFNSITKIATATCALPCSPGKVLYLVKGAPERVLDLCSMRLQEGREEEEEGEEEGGEEGGGGSSSNSSFSSSSSSSSSNTSNSFTTQEVPITTLWKESWHAAYERFALNGERVLGFAYATLSTSDTASPPTSGLVFAGLVSLKDPPKAGAAKAVARCKQAGIRVVMITGDHPLSECAAESIARSLDIITLPTAREVGVRVRGEGEGVTSLFHDLLGEIPSHLILPPTSPLPSSSTATSAAAAAAAAATPLLRGDPRVRAAVVTGYQLSKLSPQELDAVLSLEEVVFARTSPEQKKEIVVALQRLGHCVGMTGDGTNDSPALKCSDVGIVMAGGESVSDVARETGDVIVMDSNIESVIDCVEEGRLISVNMRKAITYTVTHAIPELVPVFINLVFDVPIMLPGLCVLVVDIFTEQVSAISLTYEPPEANLMLEPPRNLITQPLVDVNMILYAYVLVAFLESMTCVGAFFLAMAYYGYPISTLLYNSSFWNSPNLPPAALAALRGSVSAYLFTLVMCQAVHLYVVKTRRTSMFVHPICANWMSQLGVVISIGVAVLCIYPLQGSLFGTGDMDYWVSWTLWILFGIALIPIMESFKYCARRGWTTFP